jgi:hypothetical protein
MFPVCRPWPGLKRVLFVFSASVHAQGCLTLTLGTACILAAGGYVDGKQPWEERGARRDPVIVKVVVCIVRALREGGLFGIGTVGCRQGRGMRELQARSLQLKPPNAQLENYATWGAGRAVCRFQRNGKSTRCWPVRRVGFGVWCRGGSRSGRRGAAGRSVEAATTTAVAKGLPVEMVRRRWVAIGEDWLR